MEAGSLGVAGVAPCAHGSPGETDANAAAGGVGKSHLWLLELHTIPSSRTSWLDACEFVSCGC